MRNETEGKEWATELYNSGRGVKEGVGKGIAVESRQLSKAVKMEGALSLNHLGIEHIRIDNT